MQVFIAGGECREVQGFIRDIRDIITSIHTVMNCIHFANTCSQTVQLLIDQEIVL